MERRQMPITRRVPTFDGCLYLLGGATGCILMFVLPSQAPPAWSIVLALVGLVAPVALVEALLRLRDLRSPYSYRQTERAVMVAVEQAMAIRDPSDLDGAWRALARYKDGGGSERLHDALASEVREIESELEARVNADAD